MSLRVFQTPESLADVALQAEYYAKQVNFALAARFIAAVRVTEQLLETHPRVGKETRFRHPKLRGMRLYLVQKPFQKHLIFYRVGEGVLDIVRVIHGFRDLPRRLLDPPGAG